MAEISGQAETAAISKNRIVSARICQSGVKFGAGVFILFPDSSPRDGCQVTKS